MFQELIKIAEEVYRLDKELGIKMGKCLEGLGKKVSEHNKESKQKPISRVIKTVDSAIKHSTRSGYWCQH